MSVLALVLQEEHGSGSIGPAGGAWEAAGEEAALALGLLHPPCCTHSCNETLAKYLCIFDVEKWAFTAHTFLGPPPSCQVLNPQP